MIGKNNDYIITDTNVMVNTISPKYVNNMLTMGGVI